jgi:hypothetical protein
MPDFAGALERIETSTFSQTREWPTACARHLRDGRHPPIAISWTAAFCRRSNIHDEAVARTPDAVPVKGQCYLACVAEPLRDHGCPLWVLGPCSATRYSEPTCAPGERTESIILSAWRWQRLPENGGSLSGQADPSVPLEWNRLCPGGSLVGDFDWADTARPPRRDSLDRGSRGCGPEGRRGHP